MLGYERGSRRNTLLRWCQKAVAKFLRVEITNFSKSWADGRALCCLLASFYPNKLNIGEICSLEAEECLKLALSVGTDIGVEVEVKVTDFKKEDRPECSLVMRQNICYSVVLSNRGSIRTGASDILFENVDFILSRDKLIRVSRCN
ncbi:hypothetical protein LOAG_07895 [Loa loa]|uniref:Calponin-homology (CH) domain-containing protein n=1 Tax=Loa loa TaxID=7209 RepID=A0A1S0TUX8_LOALO|nr:hypothetical protein LOAG_07895 [Loa loa]EFO20597.2 hypothetical protein LOAG_07895 [Loa loa]